MIAFEERIYDAVVEDLQTREPTEDFKAIHVICLDTKVRGACFWQVVRRPLILFHLNLHSSMQLYQLQYETDLG